MLQVVFTDDKFIILAAIPIDRAWPHGPDRFELTTAREGSTQPQATNPNRDVDATHKQCRISGPSGDLDTRT